MKSLGLFSLLPFILLACDSATPTNEPQYPNSDVFEHSWAMDRLWEDGQAEVATYDAQRSVYGRIRQFEYTYIVVKEEFNREFNVKTDNYNRDDLFSVMKVNKFASFETENYPYHYLTSVFLKREKPEQIYKMTHTGQEWCGNTFKQFQLTSAGYEYDYNSYFDNAGAGTMQIEGNDILWEDQLSYTLRALKFPDGLTFQRTVAESEVNTRARRPTYYQNAAFSVTDEGDTWLVTVKLDDRKTNTYSFKKAYPNLMVSQQSWDGFSLQLKKVSRYQYWR